MDGLRDLKCSRGAGQHSCEEELRDNVTSYIGIRGEGDDHIQGLVRLRNRNPFLSASVPT